MKTLCCENRASWLGGLAALTLLLLGLIFFSGPRLACAEEPWLQRGKFTADDASGNDWFGYAVAVSDTTIVVGAPEADVTHANQGAVYVFAKGDQGWTDITQVAKLTASDGALNDNFGSSVAVDGDTVVVGVSEANSKQGAAYVFAKPAGGWSDMTQTAKLTASDGAAGDLFGYSVGVAGDAVVIGAQQGDGAVGDQGCAYMFVKPGDGWSDMTQTGKLTASDGAADDQFGNSVAIDGDDVIVGSPRADASQGNVGAAYIFQKPGGGWSDMTQIAKLTAGDGLVDDKLGTSVSISGDAAVAGAYYDSVDGTNAQGSAYVFEKTGTDWVDMTHTAKLTSSDGAFTDFFGTSVAISGDNVVVGAYYDDVDGTDQGSMYGFAKGASGWSDMTESVKITADDAMAYDYFGWSVAISGTMVLVGAYQDDSSIGSNVGSFYVVEARKQFRWPLFLPAIRPSEEQ